MSEETAEYQVKTKSGIMNDNVRNTFASYGLEILKHSVLLVLYQQPLDGGGKHRRPLKQEKICRQLGKPWRTYDRKGQGLVCGILAHLEYDKYVEDFGGGEWRIAEGGVSVIEG